MSNRPQKWLRLYARRYNLQMMDVQENAADEMKLCFES